MEHPITAAPAMNELQVLTLSEASSLLSVSIPVMDRWRAAGEGPRFIRLSARRIGYRLSDLRAWIESRAQGGARAA